MLIYEKNFYSNIFIPKFQEISWKAQSWKKWDNQTISRELIARNKKQNVFLKFICVTRKLQLLRNIENSRVDTCF